MKTIINLLWGILVCLIGVQGLSGQNNNYADYKLQDDVVIINDNTNQFLETNLKNKLNEDNNIFSKKMTIEFGKKTPILNKIKKGTIMACSQAGVKAPSGYIGRVEQVLNEGEKTKCIIRPVALNEIFEYVHYKYNYDIAKENPEHLQRIDGSFGLCPSLTISAPNLPNNVDVNATIEVCGNFIFNLDLDAGISWSSPMPDPSIEFSLNAQVTATVSTNFVMSLGINDALNEPLGSFPFAALPPIGPIVLVPKFQPILTIEDIVTGNEPLEISLEPRVEVQIEGEIGFNSNDGGWYEDFNPPTATIDFDAPNWGFIQEGVKIALEGRLALTVNSYDGIALGIGAEINATVNGTNCDDHLLNIGYRVPVTGKLIFSIEEIENSGIISLPSWTPGWVKDWEFKVLNFTEYIIEDCKKWSYISCSTNTPPPLPNCNITSDFLYNPRPNREIDFYSSTTNTNKRTWYFGDGSSASNVFNPSHQYPQDGVYTACLLAENNNCTGYDWKCRTISVGSGGYVAPPPPPPPAAEEEDVPPPTCIPMAAIEIAQQNNWTVTFNGGISQNANSYQWNFGDGQTANGPNPTHTYAHNGTYTVTLTITNGSCSPTSHVANFTTTVNVGACQSYHQVIYPLNTTIQYDATDYILANNTISSSSNVTFNAGQEVMLIQGFHAEKGANFHAFLQGCNIVNREEGEPDKIENEENRIPTTPETEIVDDLNIKAYPNPFDNILTIDLSTIEETAGKLYLFDLQGKLIMEEVFDGVENDLLELNTNHLNKGLYIVQVQAGYKIYTHKLVK